MPESTDCYSIASCMLLQKAASTVIFLGYSFTSTLKFALPGCGHARRVTGCIYLGQPEVAVGYRLRHENVFRIIITLLLYTHTEAKSMRPTLQSRTAATIDPPVRSFSSWSSKINGNAYQQMCLFGKVFRVGHWFADWSWTAGDTLVNSEQNVLTYKKVIHGRTFW